MIMNEMSFTVYIFLNEWRMFLFHFWHVNHKISKKKILCTIIDVCIYSIIFFNLSRQHKSHACLFSTPVATVEEVEPKILFFS